MKKKIHARLVLISILAVLFTVISITVLYYELFQERVKKDLVIEAMLIRESGVENLMLSDTITGNQEIRITWIDADGRVLFDNDADASKLENHKDRPEIADAFQKGHGESVRESDTMNLRNFYYAVLCDDGTVIRVSIQARSIINLFLSAIPVMAVIIVAVLVFCYLISRILTRQLLSPIEKMAQDIENYNQTPEYSELVPFVQTIRKQHEDILNSALTRQDFSANVSHELKTPLTAISGYAELIENKMVDADKTIHFATEIRRNSQRLLSLINDIIRLSELDHASEKEGFETIDLYAVLMECMDDLRENARQKNVSVNVSGDSCRIFANKLMMKEMIYNLCQNAIRYNVENGKVDIRVFRREEQIVFEVKDTGIGIPLKDQGRIFERFYRVDKSRSRETGGTGLGLAIVKHVVELHSGKIMLESEVGKGTDIQVSFS